MSNKEFTGKQIIRELFIEKPNLVAKTILNIDADLLLTNKELLNMLYGLLRKVTSLNTFNQKAIEGMVDTVWMLYNEPHKLDEWLFSQLEITQKYKDKIKITYHQDSVTIDRQFDGISLEIEDAQKLLNFDYLSQFDFKGDMVEVMKPLSEELKKRNFYLLSLLEKSNYKSVLESNWRIPTSILVQTLKDFFDKSMFYQVDNHNLKE